jgi:hypothetical protein
MKKVRRKETFKKNVYEGKMVSLVEVYSSLSQKQRKPLHEGTEY